MGACGPKANETKTKTMTFRLGVIYNYLAVSKLKSKRDQSKNLPIAQLQGPLISLGVKPLAKSGRFVVVTIKC